MKNFFRLRPELLVRTGVAVTVFALMACGEGDKPPAARILKTAARENPAKRMPAAPHGTLERLRASLRAEDMAAAMEELIGSPLLEDPAVVELILAHFPDYPPELLAELLRKWPDNFESRKRFTGRLREILAEMPDVATIEKYVRLLPKQDRSGFLKHFAHEGRQFTPQNFAAFLAMSETAEDRDALGTGLALRLGAMEDGKRLTEAQAYLDLNPPAEIGRALVEISMYNLAGGNLAQAAEWLLAQPAEITRGADAVLMGKLGGATGARDMGAGFIQQLIDSGQSERAAAALAPFVFSFGAVSPQDAMSWALELPDSLGAAKVKAATNAFLLLRHRDPQAAERLANQVTDPAVTGAIRRYTGPRP